VTVWRDRNEKGTSFDGAELDMHDVRIDLLQAALLAGQLGARVETQ
jgi:hypothetical protein